MRESPQVGEGQSERDSRAGSILGMEPDARLDPKTLGS